MRTKSIPELRQHHSVAVTAALLGMSKAFVRSMVNKGEIEGFLLGGKQLMLPVASVNAFLERKRIMNEQEVNRRLEKSAGDLGQRAGMVSPHP